jgi:hypothetical protein
MSKNIAVSEDLYSKAAELAARHQVSIEEFVSILLANRVASREFIESRAGLFSRADLDRALDDRLGGRRTSIRNPIAAMGRAGSLEKHSRSVIRRGRAILRLSV